MISNGTTRRAPPAYQQYASDRLADRAFKSMSVSERGLLHSMELEAWCNRTLPFDKRDLARVLGLDVAEVDGNLTERVLRHFEQHDGELVCPELDAYRDKLEERHAKMSKGGAKGAEQRWKPCRNDKPPNGGAIGEANGVLSREEKSREEKSVFSEEHSEFRAALEGDPPFLAGKNAGAPENHEVKARKVGDGRRPGGLACLHST